MTAVRRGFTLLELLVAMAAAALLLALLSQASGQLHAAARRVFAGGQAQQDIDVAAQLLGRLLSDALPPAPGDDANGFVGRRDAIDFTAVPPDALQHLGPVRVRLMLAPMSAGQSGLFVEFRRAFSRDAGDAPPRRELVVGPLQSIRFGFAAENGANRPLLAQWHDEGRPPGLVQVVWRRTEADAPTVVTAAVRRTLPGSCQFDPISLVCRSADAR